MFCCFQIFIQLSNFVFDTILFILMVEVCKFVSTNAEKIFFIRKELSDALRT